MIVMTTLTKSSPAIRCGEPEDIMNGILERKCQVFITITNTIIIITTIIITTIIITTMMAMITKVGQSHGGFLGLVQQTLSRAAAHIWFQVLLPLFLIIIIIVTKVIVITIVIIVIIVIIIVTISVTDTLTISNN